MAKLFQWLTAPLGDSDAPLTTQSGELERLQCQELRNLERRHMWERQRGLCGDIVRTWSRRDAPLVMWVSTKRRHSRGSWFCRVWHGKHCVYQCSHGHHTERSAKRCGKRVVNKIMCGELRPATHERVFEASDTR